METYFFKGKENILDSDKKKVTELKNDSDIKKIKDAFLKVLDNKNLSFLLGSGCSSFEIEREKNGTKEKENIQVGIPVMCPLAKEFYSLESFSKYRRWLKLFLKIDVEKENFKTNLEVFLSTLHSLSFYYSASTKNEISEKTYKRIEEIIKETRYFLLKKVLNQDNISKGLDKPLLDIYKQFYRKLLSRNSQLPRLNIFTTNYDLYSEKAMDLLGIHYVNGFTGGISKFFNPTIFNYALAEKMDLSQSKWNVIENFFYLYKIHGSVNWVEEGGENKLFKVKEIQDPTLEYLKNSKKEIMIYPTPLKYNASFGSPYSDLFREFQRKLMINNNILVTVGYSFSDEHINNLIFQAFTIPSFRLIIIGNLGNSIIENQGQEDEEKNNIYKLFELNDPRIWIIGGKEDGKQPLHFFERFVNEILPDLSNEDLDNKMETTINNLKNLLK